MEMLMAKDRYADQMMAASSAIKDQIMQGIANSSAIQNEILGAAGKAMARGERQRQRDVAAASGQIIPFTEEDMQ